MTKEDIEKQNKKSSTQKRELEMEKVKVSGHTEIIITTLLGVIIGILLSISSKL